jgi:hypothetical protein
MSTQTTTDLAARFEAQSMKFAEQAQQAYDCGDEASEATLSAKANAFAEARDMARADAAGGADGFVLVPAEATEEMWQAGLSADAHPGDSYSATYRAMIAAAPPPPAQQDSGTRYQYREIGEGEGWRDCSKATYDSFAHDPHIDTREVPPPPAQQGSSSPLSQGETVGELERLKDLVKRARLAALSDNTLYGNDAGSLYDDLADAIVSLVPASLATARDDGTGVGEAEAPGAAACRQAAQRASEQMAWAKPTPDPVGEARTLLEGLPKWLGPQQFIEVCRKMGDHKQADRFEAALATLNATDPGGEVRDV